MKKRSMRDVSDQPKDIVELKDSKITIEMMFDTLEWVLNQEDSNK